MPNRDRDNVRSEGGEIGCELEHSQDDVHRAVGAAGPGSPSQAGHRPRGKRRALDLWAARLRGIVNPPLADVVSLRERGR
jgi:hypothetical protein